MYCETFQKLQRLAKQNPERFCNMTEKELERWINGKREVKKNVGYGSSRSFYMYDSTLRV